MQSIYERTRNSIDIHLRYLGAKEEQFHMSFLAIKVSFILWYFYDRELAPNIDSPRKTKFLMKKGYVNKVKETRKIMRELPDQLQHIEQQ